MVLSMRVNGKKISSMGMVKSPGQMEHSTKDSIRLERKKEKVSFIGQMGAHMTESFMTITFMAKDL